MQAVRSQDIGADAFDQWFQHPDTLAAPINQGRGRDVCAHPGKDLVLAIKRKVIVEL